MQSRMNTTAAILCLGLLLCGQAARASDLSEARALERARRAAGLDDIARATELRVEGDALAASQWPNPELSWSVETLGRPGVDVEQVIGIDQGLDLSGRRSLRQDAIAARARIAREETRRLLAEVSASTRAAYAELLASTARVDALRRWLDGLEAVRDIVDEQVRGGVASSYARSRLAAEEAAGRARLSRASGDLTRAWIHLQGLTELEEGSDPPPALAEPLVPEGPLPALADLLARIDAAPSVQVLDATARAASLDERAAARAWIPALTVGAGYRHVRQDDRDGHGFMVSLAAPLPAFTRGAAAARSARAERLRARGERARLSRTLVARLRATHHDAKEAAETASDQRAAVVVASERLCRDARDAYLGGALSLFELLDAHRSLLDARLESIALGLDARAARDTLLNLLEGGIP
jgi:outer membrane protein, heavy metal efflux system